MWLVLSEEIRGGFGIDIINLVQVLDGLSTEEWGKGVEMASLFCLLNLFI